ncbi:hypothetical protein [Paeniglutamicibacter psychrophenolicus]|uniref:hypothetical protein n=1 Tax=Paeniglutamicibacter psychrophenolicus TaxID=257454 RepID=UPI0027808BCC|nr:hypothetical protein [Paeniglutamicibacter psychrophenolicus]MDQ0095323.1 hypothetical protein [Paeniglutamicibacter psychrophenolicus]
MTTELALARSRAVRAALAGFGLVACYAVVGALQILVWNPLAAVPGATLAEIRAQMAGAREHAGTPLVVAWSLTGILLGAGVLVAALRRKISAAGAVTLSLLLIVLGAPSIMVASFPSGMGLADTFGISGGDHAPWGALLYLASAAALLLLLVLFLVRRRPRPIPVPSG